MRIQDVLSAVLAVGLAAPALAQDTPAEGGGEAAPMDAAPMEEMTSGDMSGDSMVLKQGQVGVGAALGIGVDKSAVGKILGLKLGGAYGVIENLQAGLMLDVLLKHPADDAALSGVALGGQYQVMEFLAPTLDINIVRVVPSATIGGMVVTGDAEYKVAIGLSAPLKYKVSDAFALKALHDVCLRPGTAQSVLGTPLIYFGADPLKKGFALAVGSELMAGDAVKLGLDLAIVLPDFKSDLKQVPLVLKGAYTTGAMDVGLAFGFDNLTPPDVTGAPGAADSRYIALFFGMAI